MHILNKVIFFILVVGSFQSFSIYNYQSFVGNFEEIYSETNFVSDQVLVIDSICNHSDNQWNYSCVKNTIKKINSMKAYLYKRGYSYVQNPQIDFTLLAILEAEKRYTVDHKLILAVAITESGLNPRAISIVGARGLLQVMPATATGIWNDFLVTLPLNDSLRAKAYPCVNSLYKIRLSVLLGTFYLDRLLKRFNYNPIYALASYNVGPTKVSRSIKRNPYRAPANLLLGQSYYQKILNIHKAI